MHINEVRAGNHWTGNSNPVLSKKQPIVCSHSECGKSFAKPIELKVLLDKEKARYFACPYCFWPVGPEKVVLVNTNVERKMKLSQKQPVRPDGCEHFLGYLETLPRDSPISRECFSCDAILKCAVSKKKRRTKRK